MAPIGSITSRIQLEKDIFRGSDDPVTGNVELTIQSTDRSAAKQEIFGPLILSVVLRCHIKLIVRENRTSHAHILFHERREISRKTLTLFDGPFRASAGQPSQIFPFQVNFPARTDQIQNKRVPLPPTFHTRFQVVAPKQFGKHHGQAWVVHSLGVEVNMPGIDVQMLNASNFTVIQYEQDGSLFHVSSGTREFQSRLEFETYELLPEQERPGSLLDKTMAVMRKTTKPVYVLDAICSNIPEAIAVGESFSFNLRVRPETEATTATIVPEVLFTRGKIDLIAITKLYATNERGVDSPQLEHSDAIATMAVEDEDPGRPFSKSNDFTKTLLPTTLLVNVRGQFNVVKLERSYRLRIELQLMVASQTRVLKKDLDVRLLPAGNTSTAEGSSSRPGRNLTTEYEQLPAYETAVGAPSSAMLVPMVETDIIENDDF